VAFFQFFPRDPNGYPLDSLNANFALVLEYWPNILHVVAKFSSTIPDIHPIIGYFIGLFVSLPPCAPKQTHQQSFQDN